MDQIVQAIDIASDPSQASLHQQALDYLKSIQQNAQNTWTLALPLFVESTPEGSRKYGPQARFFALRVLDDFLDNRYEPLDDETFRTIQQALVSYIQAEFAHGSAEASAPYIRNKFSHTLSLFFLSSYMTQWPSFFADLFSLIRPAATTSSAPTPAFNRNIIILFFHIVIEISGEVADQTLKAARTFVQERHVRDMRVRDAVRERDAVGINEAVLTLVAEAAEQMKKGERSMAEVVDLGIRTFSSYVGWIDINLTVTPTTVPLLFSFLADPSLAIRLATANALSRIVAKGLKEPGDKLQLLKVLALGQVVDALESKTREEKMQRTEADEGEESYREALGRLLNVLALELLKLIEESGNEAVASEATVLLNQILPVALRIMADEYDDTSNTVFPMLRAVLLNYKRVKNLAPLDENKRSFLTSLLQVTITKAKWDEESDPDDLDEEDSAEFEAIRKELLTLLESTYILDPELVTNAIQSLSQTTGEAYRNGLEVKWNDAELGVYLVYIFGEINKSKGRPAFCVVPGVVAKDQKKAIDYSEFPLTPHGEMLLSLVQANIPAYPTAMVGLQFFETVSRYPDFFKVRKECILPTLEAMIGTRGIHHENATHRSRVFYLFYRFVKEIKNDIPTDVAVNVANSIRDLLTIEVTLPDGDDSDSTGDPLTDAIKSSAFDSQLYLYETVGTLCSLLYRTPDQLSSLLVSFIRPMMSDLSDNLQAFRTKGSQDVVPIVKVHHGIMALGNIAKGFPDYPNPLPPDYIPPPVELFTEIAQAILVCLEAMNVFKDLREAARFAFTRILASAGPNVAHFIPQLMSNLLAHFEPAELVDFLNFIGLLVHKLQEQLFSVLDELITPLSAHITGYLAQPVTGTDDQRVHVETKKAYIVLLNSIMSSKIPAVLTSDRNQGGFDALMANMLQIGSDLSDPVCQRGALQFIVRTISIWGLPTTSDGSGPSATKGLPGFEEYIYKRILPAVFQIPSLADFSLKEPAHAQVLNEVANVLQAIFKARGTEAYDYFLSAFLPSQGWPQESALEFTVKLRDLDTKAFRKYFADFVRSSRTETIP
ncbi:Exportin-T [Mycena kentingensis (nom. inval.)]|nr:Exportin-T [Mycena kentingensis (nom. inval.)]